jgi:hypothetical protein
MAPRTSIEEYEEFMTKLDSVLANNNLPVIVAGDINIVLDPHLDAEKNNPSSLFPALIKKWERLMEKYGLLDVWRQQHPEEKAFTFTPGGSRCIYRRLDYVFASGDLSDLVHNLQMRSTAFSDHKEITFSLRSKCQKRPFRLWKHKDVLLENPDYVTAISGAIADAVQDADNDELSPQAKWEFVKYKIRQRARAEEKRLFAEEKETERRLQRVVNAAQSDHSRAQEARDALMELQRLDLKRNNRLITASRVQWAEENERSSRFFYNRIKQGQANSNIISLKVDGNNLEDKEVDAEIHRFYSTLYGFRHTDRLTGSWLDTARSMGEDIREDKEKLAGGNYRTGATNSTVQANERWESPWERRSDSFSTRHSGSSWGRSCSVP